MGKRALRRSTRPTGFGRGSSYVCTVCWRLSITEPSGCLNRAMSCASRRLTLDRKADVSGAERRRHEADTRSGLEIPDSPKREHAVILNAGNGEYMEFREGKRGGTVCVS